MKFRTKRNLLRVKLLRDARRFLKRIRIPRYANHSVYELITGLFRNISDHEIIDRANAVAFNLILATFPGIIFLFTLIPYASRLYPQLNQDSIMFFLSAMLPKSMYETVAETVLDIVSIQRDGLLTFGFLVSLFLATNGMVALIKAFNSVYKTTERRTGWRMHLTAMSLTILLAVVLMLAVVLIIVGELVVLHVSENLKDFAHLQVDQFSLMMFNLLRFAVVFIGFFLSISCIYYFGPAVHYNWRFFSAGSVMATLGSLAVSYGFSAYVTRFGSYNKIYGSIGVLIAMMVWIQLLATVLLLGYELNATLHQREHGHRSLETGRRVK
ncbi:MAG: YihY/virulence factor BrkB family protein [Bacteroidota bacterium]